jgi:hypothetical protein
MTWHLVAFIVVLFVIGVVCLVFPEATRQYAIRDTDSEQTRSFMRTRGYLWTIRLTGLVSLIMAVSALWLSLRGG